MKLLLTILLTAVIVITCVPIKAAAHQNGCHRWHSCPSDTGSYVCGDLGYYTYCGGETDVEEPDYQSDGHDKGLDHANRDATAIKQQATNSGDSDGYNDGIKDDYEDNSPDAQSVCDKTFTFQGNAPDEYKDAYHEAYSDSCTDRFNDAYKTAYTAGYNRGQDEFNARKNEVASNSQNSSTDDSSSGGNWLWGAIVGGGAILYGSSIFKDARKRRRN